MLIAESQSLDVCRNLAIEEYLLDHVVDHGPALFLWRSECAVVIGKNQNPWRECQLDRMRADGVPLARRISGGGTVYHDRGNLNYCVIVNRTAYRKEQAYDMVLGALRTFGIHAEVIGKSSLGVNGRKFSGNAFCFRKGRALHHGTLLLDTDLDRLNRYLGPTLDGIETRAVTSVPAEVMNLGLGVEEAIRALERSFCSLYGNGELNRWPEAHLDQEVIEPLFARQVSDEWRYGATPRFSVKQEGSLLQVEHGEVVRAEGNSAMWLGKPFKDVAHSWKVPD